MIVCWLGALFPSSHQVRALKGTQTVTPVAHWSTVVLSFLVTPTDSQGNKMSDSFTVAT